MLVDTAYPTANVLGTQITLSALSVAFIQWLKNSPLMPSINAGSDTINRIISAVLAFCSALGVHFAWSAGVAAGDYTLHITGLTAAGIGLMAWGMIKQFAFNELAYRGTVKSVALPPGYQVVGGQAGAPMKQEAKALKE